MMDANERFAEGVRFLADGDLNAAIRAFQETQVEPSLRAASMNLIGQAFMDKGWRQEAIDTFRNAIEIAPADNEMLLLELRARLMHAMRANDQ